MSSDLTSNIKQKLQAELDGLESELRIHLPKEIKRALEFGDLRENSEYQTALQRQTMVKARIPVAGLLPAIRAARMSPTEALRTA